MPAGTQRAVLQGHTSRVLALAFAPNGKSLAAGGGKYSDSGEVTLWSVATGGLIASLAGHKEWIECVAFSPDSKILVSGGGNVRNGPGEFKFWDLTKIPALESEN